MANVQTAASTPSFSYDPFRLLWRLFTSVRFALALIGFLAIAALLGVLIPQVPAEMQGNPVAISAWLNFQEGKFGIFTSPMDRIWLFDVFRSPWFVSLLGTLVVSVCICTVNRFGPIWRNSFHPLTRVPDDYLERGDPAFMLADPPATEALAAGLRRKRYRVTLSSEGDTTYLFADRYPWAQLATFISHLALILFLAGGVVTLITAKEEQVFVGEGDSGSPVFAPNDPDHMQIYVSDAVGKFSSKGMPLDYRSQLTVYKDGQLVASGTSTVNHPLSYGGFKFHQSAYFPDGAALQVKELATGRLVYDEVLALTQSAATPAVQVRDAAGNLLLDDIIVPTDFIADAAGTTVTIPGTDRQFWVGARPGNDASGWQLIVFETADPNGVHETFFDGESKTVGGLQIAFVGMKGIPSTAITDLPGGGDQSVAEISDGPAGKLLTVGPVNGQALALSPNAPVQVAGYEYTFLGPREFSGITVRRDRGSTFIWLATGLFLLGLALTFYTPRRRLWGKIANGRAVFRGLGGRSTTIEREVQLVAARAIERSPETSRA